LRYDTGFLTIVLEGCRRNIAFAAAFLLEADRGQVPLSMKGMSNMNTHALKTLEYDKIKESIKQHAFSEAARAMLDRLEPSVDLEVVKGWLQETTEAAAALAVNPSVPLSAMTDLENAMQKVGKGMILQPEELYSVKNLLECVRRMKKYMAAMEQAAPVISTYARSMYTIGELYDEIDRCIVNGRVDDRASAELHRIRKKIDITDERIRQKLGSLLNAASAAGFLQDAVISTRNGRYVIPVKREHRKSVEGSVLDTSASGSTVFVEPAGVAKLQEELGILRMEEENEVYRILARITGIVDTHSREISINMEALAHYDFLFAKGKYSRSMEMSSVCLNRNGRIDMKGAKHPLIGRSAVPLDFHIGDGYRALVITGPNTGGKTVALKTVGLLSLMVQSGMHVPVAAGSEFAVFTDILADIGDGQSIEQSLSTFSSHVKNISTIIECASPNTLVVMDEAGAGTDPSEGMGFAVAVLERIYEKGATVLATTHYNEIKEFASVTPGFKNGCMGFDIHTLKPLYNLKIGQPGESNAFLIALRLGMDVGLIERAHEITYKEKRDYSKVLSAEHHAEREKLIDRDAVLSHEQQIRNAEKAKTFAKQMETADRDAERKAQKSFHVGDCVRISTMSRTGIVCEPENEKGEVVVMVMKKKFKVNVKRLTLYIDGKEMYPDNYDYDVVLESKENRRKKKTMGKRHVEGLAIEKGKEEL
jgi:MutS2 family protein